jgi:hypothetical protein
MASERDFQVERAELDSVLASGIFARSPILVQMLKYVCEKRFQSESSQIKEYNVAVEALGRPANFDQSRDSIVRVEAHRLRKRLQEYYSGAGASHDIQIVITPGNYAPQFIRRSDAAPPLAEDVRTDEPEILMSAARIRSWQPLRLGFAFLCLAVLTTSFFWARAAREKSALVLASANGPNVSALPALPEDEVRILAGSTVPKIVDHYGNTWSSDRYFHGGVERVSPPRPIAFTQDPVMFYRFRQGEFSYDIPLKKGVYELRLYFAETVFGENNVAGGGETTRVFRIMANGTELLGFLDVISDAGGSNTADIKVFKDIWPAEDGMLHLQFVRVNNEVPFLNAIEILPSKAGAIRPIRILARDSGHTDQNNRLWSADRYYHNGVLVQRHDSVGGTEDEPLYQNERFGNFSYTIPVALNSRYTVTMKFCEAWFGADRPGGGGVGERLFDVFFNGRILLGNFDVFKNVGSLRAIDKTFKGLEPNMQGKLTFSFTPTRNYAMINAIEVLDEAWK